MCGTCASDDLVALARGREAADTMLERLRVPVAKAIDPSTPRGFDAVVARLAAALRRRAGGLEADALTALLRALDVDWPSARPSARRSAIDRARQLAEQVLAGVPARARETVTRAAREVVEATRSDVRRRQRLAIGADLNAVDTRAVAYLGRASELFVRDEYGRRLDAFGDVARRVVAAGLEQGLGRDDIAQDLAAAAERAMVQRSASYWDLVAASWVGEARSMSQISAYAEAGIERYKIVAVLDEHTTDTCRYLDGKVLEVADALRTLGRLEAAEDPLALKSERPWVRERVGDDGRRVIGVGETELAVVERSGVGVRDDRGEYARAHSSRDLAPAGIGYPPWHGYCRSTTVADL
jgi:SPP1 gp7 family putative phage head morphogenesis protein